MSALRLVIFDMDGTLIDSQRAILAAMARAYSQLGAPPPADEAVRRIIGLSLPEAFARLSPEADNARLATLYKESYVALRREAGGAEDAPLYPGARAALATQAARGRLLSVATGKARRGVDHAVAAHGLEGLFTFVQTADDARSKPHPEMVERCMDLHGVDGPATVMVGDTSYDMEMARAAGARALGVAWGYHPREALIAAGAEAVIDGFADLDAAATALLEAT